MKKLTLLLLMSMAAVSAKDPAKGDHMHNAIEYLDEAIACARMGDGNTVQQNLSKAISNVKSGIARAK